MNASRNNIHVCATLIAALTIVATNACTVQEDTEPSNTPRRRVVFDGAALQEAGAPITATIDVRPSANTDYVFDQTVAPVDVSRLSWMAPGDDAPQPFTIAAEEIGIDLSQEELTIRSGEAPDEDYRVACGSFDSDQADLDCEVTCYYWGCDYWCCSGGSHHSPRVM